MTEAKDWIEIIAALTMLAAVGGVVWHRIQQKMGIGVRSIQFIGVGTLVPLILILALEGVLERSAVGTLIGALIGYLLSKIGKYDEHRAEPD